MLAMNRDEQVSRPRALAPRRHWTGTRASLYPSEAGGGTWIGTNDAGLTLALVNWYAKPQCDRILCVSRGIIIPHLLAAESLADVAAMFADLPLSQINPFRLIVASAKERQLREWRWDGERTSASGTLKPRRSYIRIFIQRCAGYLFRHTHICSIKSVGSPNMVTAFDGLIPFQMESSI